VGGCEVQDLLYLTSSIQQGNTVCITWGVGTGLLELLGSS